MPIKNWDRFLQHRVADFDASGLTDSAAEGAMTADQAAYLKALALQLSEPDAFDETLSRVEATKRIAALEARLAHERRSGVERFPRT